MTILSTTSAMMTVRGYFSFLGSDFRIVRLITMVAVLWLLTPWWGRCATCCSCSSSGGRSSWCSSLSWPDSWSPRAPVCTSRRRSTRRCHLADSPDPGRPLRGRARRDHHCLVVRRSGEIAHHDRHHGSVDGGLGPHPHENRFGGLLDRHLGGRHQPLLRRERVRRAFAITLVVAALVTLSFAPVIGSWLSRGQSGEQITALTGRTQTWSALLAQPRTEVNTLFGYGMSNASFNGLPIDSSWLSTYLEQGLVGDVIEGAVVLTLLLVACFSPRGPRPRGGAVLGCLLPHRVLHRNRSRRCVALSARSDGGDVGAHDSRHQHQAIRAIDCLRRGWFAPRVARGLTAKVDAGGQLGCAQSG